MLTQSDDFPDVHVRARTSHRPAERVSAPPAPAGSARTHAIPDLEDDLQGDTPMCVREIIAHALRPHLVELDAELRAGWTLVVSPRALYAALFGTRARVVGWAGGAVGLTLLHLVASAIS